jgi:hypothetical protein
MEAELTEDQLRAELRAAGKEALVGFALGVAAAGTIDMTQRIADCVKRFQAADLLTVRGRAAIVSAPSAVVKCSMRPSGLRRSSPRPVPM